MARILIAIGVGLALADASVVTLGLPEILVEFDTTVEGAAAVLGIYTLVLGAALIPAEWLRRRWGSARLAIGGFIVFAITGAGCALANDISALLAFRGLQALGGAAALVCGFALLEPGEGGRRQLWTTAAIAGTAAGPALGGLLTELFDWRAIFIVQAPLGLLAAAGCQRLSRARRDPATAMASLPPLLPPRGDLPQGPLTGLALVSAALSGVLFLLVLLLVSGWSLSPLAAAATVSVIAVAALAGGRIGGEQRVRASVGCALVGAGLVPLAFLSSASVAWVIVPMILAGVGMGLALTSLVGHLLPEETPAETAFLLAVRHAGVTLALVLLAPIAATQLDHVIGETRERGAALVLDAELGPLDKLELAEAVTAELDPIDPRETLRRSLDDAAAEHGDFDETGAYAELRHRADEALIDGVNDAFSTPFLIAAALALIGAVAVLPLGRGRAMRTSVAVSAAALALAGAQALLSSATADEGVEIADPCDDRDLPSTGGIDGIAQDAALLALDRAACNFGSSREELALALIDDEAAEDFEAEYGVDPRSVGDIVRGVIGF